MSVRNWHLIAYDIRDDKRLRQVARLLEGYGVRVQYSLFRCRLTTEALERLRWQLATILAEVDSLLVVPLCSRCAEKIPTYSTPDQTDWGEPPPTYRIL